MLGKAPQFLSQHLSGAPCAKMRRMKVLLVLVGITCLLLFHAFPKSLTREWNLRTASIHVFPQVFTGYSQNSSSNISDSTNNTVRVDKSRTLPWNVQTSSRLQGSNNAVQPNTTRNRTDIHIMNTAFSTSHRHQNQLESPPEKSSPSKSTESLEETRQSQMESGSNNQVQTQEDAPVPKNISTPVTPRPPRPDPLDSLRNLTVQYKGKPVPIFTPDIIRQIKLIPLAEEDKVVRVMLVTYFRSGSSFLGDLLQQNWRTYFDFEPLHLLSRSSRTAQEDFPLALRLISNIFRCQMSQSPEYATWVKKERNRFLIRWNTFLWSLCRMRPTYCFASPFMESVCVRAEYHVMKVVRLTMASIKQILDDNADLNIKVVYLVRDPRGIYNSRRFLNWCTPSKCSNVTYLCDEMQKDFQMFQQLQRSDPSRFILVRYEDIAMKPYEEARELFDFLGLPFSINVQRFIKTHTTVARKSDSRNPYSTVRNSSSTPFEWRRKMPFSLIQRAQETCSNVIDALGYVPIRTPADLNGSAPVIEKSTAPVKDLTTRKEDS